MKAAAPARSMKIVVAGGHPGDPEAGCAGTIAKLASAGHEALLLYLNRGEGYCGSEPLERCGAIRTAEAERACKILHAKPVFADQIDGQAIVDNSHYAKFQHLLSELKPDLVLAQWPIDAHRDHRALSALVLDAWLQGGKNFALYYYEVAGDTMMFTPTDYVDISDPAIEATRHEACFAHASQQPARWYAEQVEITRFRGSESGHLQAEAFLRHWQSKAVVLA
jgi:LmbE family N-acetylglucosaminyl deacetylase